MEHLQRQLEAKLDHPEKHLQQAQLLTQPSPGPSVPCLRTPTMAKVLQTEATPADPGTWGESFYEDEERKLDDSEGTDGEMDDDDEEEDDDEDVGGEEEDETGVPGSRLSKKPRLHQDPAAYYSALSLASYSSVAAAKRPVVALPPPPLAPKEEEPGEKEQPSPTERHSFTSPEGFADWSFDEPSKHNPRPSAAERTEENEGGKARGEPSRDFAKLYEIDGDPNRKEFLDELFIFMQKRGTPVNRIPIMAKQVLDLYRLYKLVTEKGGLVEVINKKIWREITKGLNLPTSITSAAFTLRTQYVYLYAFECEKKGLKLSGGAAGRHRQQPPRGASAPAYTMASTTSHPRLPHAAGGVPTLNTSTPTLPNGLPMVLALGQQQLAQAATLEHLREKLEKGAGGTGEGPEKNNMARLAEEHQRLMQQAFQQNLLAMASHFSPMNHLKPSVNHESKPESKPDLALSIGTNGAASINVSVEVNGILYSGEA
ncbi:hypothetical protein CRUP_021814 [Coryphaenoides rupestris]|nr:hypothetical protein CRUP_021814 [Coryphaenoides rupestris]